MSTVTDDVTLIMNYSKQLEMKMKFLPALGLMFASCILIVVITIDEMNTRLQLANLKIGMLTLISYMCRVCIQAFSL